MPTQTSVSATSSMLIGFLFDSNNARERALFLRAFNDEKRKSSVSGNQAVFHLTTPAMMSR